MPPLDERRSHREPVRDRHSPDVLLGQVRGHLVVESLRRRFIADDADPYGYRGQVLCLVFDNKTDLLAIYNRLYGPLAYLFLGKHVSRIHIGHGLFAGIPRLVE